MKKFGSLALAALMVTALSISASAASSLEAAAGTAEIDGEKDDIYVCDPVDIISTKPHGLSTLTTLPARHGLPGTRITSTPILK